METLVWFFSSEVLIGLVTLTALELVLGIDNIIFISIVADNLPKQDRKLARNVGLIAALGLRVLLLLCIFWIIGLTEPLFYLLGHGLSGRDLILLAGGLFLLAKSTIEIHRKLEAHDDEFKQSDVASFWPVVGQIVVLDLVFSFDSVITAVGLVPHISVMIVAVIISMGVMILASQMIADFINQHPTFKILALSFLVMIGMLLVAESFHVEVPRGYVYFAMAFSCLVECLNMRIRKLAARK